MKLLFLADVSGGTAHVGDEAMLEANLSLFRRLFPGCQTSVAAGPGWDGNRLRAEAVERLQFSRHSAAEREALLDSLTTAPDRNHAAVNAALSCDALIISGGGNLSSSWPYYVYERIAMARLAASRGTPVILLGQTLGPNLQPRERALVSELLRLSVWIGIRETYSYALALELGAEAARLSYQLDDAVFLEAEKAPEGLLKDAARPWIAVTVHPLGDASIHHPAITPLVTALRTLARNADADLVFLPHVEFREPGGMLNDGVFGEVIQRALYNNPPLRIAPVLSAPQTLWLTQQASMVISTRYHPLVFGLAGAVPCLGIWTDEYTRRKLQGALIHAGRPEDGLSLEEAMAGGLTAKVMAMWQSRAAIKEGLQTRVQQWRHDESGRTSQLAAKLQPMPSETQEEVSSAVPRWLPRLRLFGQR